MSSSPLLKHPRRWPLRTRLIVEQVALLAVICAIIGVVTGFALREFLVGELDQQLVSTADRVDKFTRQGGPPPGGNTNNSNRPPLDRPGFGVGTVSVVFRDNTVQLSSWVDDTGTVQAVPAEQLATLAAVPATARVQTVDLGPYGTYRVIGSTNYEGDLLVTGLPLANVDNTVLRMGLILGGVALAGLIAVSLAGAFIVRRTLRPLERVAATATRVAELPLHQGEVALAERVSEQDSNPDTEVGQVGLALNRMLGHVSGALKARHASETRVRQFVADASHELRTPLAAIRGYAELTRRSSDSVSPEIAHAMRRVESEAIRMTSLVEDLLLLARLDTGRPLEHREVDLSRLVLDTVGDARIAGPSQEWKLDLPPEPVVVPGDSDRLHQVLANLLTNARVHTPPGTVVTTSLSTTPTSVVLAVADNGPGIPAELQPDVFERFSRGDSSRSRAAGSTGLGLSIVAAVVSAHDGEVRLASTPGDTRFTVTLPR
ncbi:HAMP domain-containing sensor histidine kinase [Actinosynnema sp. NPDC020468]|uniref:sensor histidine kinase n=1 Tax=Actinosynnema sp. NPDC020468 TaxID=3154488 RepID=UPI0033ECE649